MNQALSEPTVGPQFDPVTTIPEHLFRPRPHLRPNQVWNAIETILIRNAALLENLDTPPELREVLSGVGAQLRQGVELLQEITA